MNDVRKPAVSGQFYSSSASGLKEQIRKCFLSSLGPGSLPEKAKKGRKIAGAVCPHAGYDFSGPAAAHAYKEIAESEAPDSYVILGTSHMGFPSCVSLNGWKTPLGIAKNDIELGMEIEKMGIPSNEGFHSGEHSIEVQVPFLQFVNPDAMICPVLAGHDMDCKSIASAITLAAKSLKRNIVIIASSDFTHYGPAYGYAPFSGNVKERMYSLDRGAIDAVLSMKSGNFMSYIKKTGATVCGQMPVSVAMEALSGKKAELLKYYTSGDVLGDYENSVGYASIIFR